MSGFRRLFCNTTPSSDERRLRWGIGIRHGALAVLLALSIVTPGVPAFGALPASGLLAALKTPDVWKLYVQSLATTQATQHNRGKNRVAAPQTQASQPAEELKRRVCGQFAVSADSVRVVQGRRPDTPFLAFYLSDSRRAPAAQTGSSGQQLGAIRDSRARFRAYLRKDGLNNFNDFAFSRGAMLYNRSVQEISATNPQMTLLKVRIAIVPWKLAVVTFFNSTDAKKMPLNRLEHTRS